MSSGTKCGRIGCEVRTEGVVTGRVRSLSSRSGQTLCWPRIAEIPLHGLTSAVALVLCIHTGVSELLAHVEWEGSSFPSGKALFFPLRKGPFCVQKMGRNDRSRDNRGTAFAYNERLPSAKLGCVETGGTHQSGPGTEGVRLRQRRINVAVTEGVFVSNMQVD